MRADEAFRTLPEPYARALELAAGGAPDENIASELDVVEDAVPALLQIAASKLESALAQRWEPFEASIAAPPEAKTGSSTAGLAEEPYPQGS